MNPLIKELYHRIHNCNICPEMDPIKMVRNSRSFSDEIEVFILSQALAEDQLRLSGVNFFKLDGNPGSTGKRLEKFLNLIGQSIYPPNDIILDNGILISARQSKYKSVYNTEITQCFPGKSKIKGDRIPNIYEINNCLNKRYIESEINLIKPKLILLMGKLSYDTFYKHILKESNMLGLSQKIADITKSGIIPKTKVFGYEVGFLPIQHASGANSSFHKMCNNDRLIQIVNKFLKSSKSEKH